MMNKKAQGTIEYLVIIAIVVVIALVVVTLLLQIMGNNSGAGDTAAISAWRASSPWSAEWSRTGNVMTVSLKNVSAETLDLNGIAFNTTDSNFAVNAKSIAPYASATITKTLTVGTCTAGNRYSIAKAGIYIDYNSTTISNKKQYATSDIVGTC